MLTILKKLPSAYYIIGVFLLCLAYAFLSNDRLPFKYVDIFDEKSYIEIVKNFSTHFFEQSFNPYYVSRLLMPGIAHLSIDYLESLLHWTPFRVSSQY